jgi:hypothetical protein
MSITLHGAQLAQLLLGCHPERSRFSGEAKDLPRHDCVDAANHGMLNVFLWRVAASRKP